MYIMKRRQAFGKYYGEKKAMQAKVFMLMLAEKFGGNDGREAALWCQTLGP